MRLIKLLARPSIISMKWCATILRLSAKTSAPLFCAKKHSATSLIGSGVQFKGFGHIDVSGDKAHFGVDMLCAQVAAEDV
jgi:hypothetical protein